MLGAVTDAMNAAPKVVAAHEQWSATYKDLYKVNNAEWVVQELHSAQNLIGPIPRPEPNQLISESGIQRYYPITISVVKAGVKKVEDVASFVAETHNEIDNSTELEEIVAGLNNQNTKIDDLIPVVESLKNHEVMVKEKISQLRQAPDQANNEFWGQVRWMGFDLGVAATSVVLACLAVFKRKSSQEQA